MLKKVKMEDVNKIKWSNILGAGAKKRKFSDTDSEKSFPKKSFKKRRKSEFVKAVNSTLLSWMSSNTNNPNPNVTL